MIVALRSFILSILLVCAAGSWAKAGDDTELVKGLSALGLQDYPTAVRLLLPLAIEGNAEAQLQIGMMYAHGRGVPKDRCLSIAWIDKAARQSHLIAAMMMSGFYEMGTGIRENPEMAYRWAFLAHKLGHPRAKGELEFLAETGLTPEQITAIEKDMATWDPAKLPPPEFFFFGMEYTGTRNERYATLVKRTGIIPCRWD